MKENTSLVLDARHLILARAISFYRQTNPATYRIDIVNELLDESVTAVIKKLTDRTLSLQEAKTENEYLSNLAWYLYGVYKNKVRNFGRKRSEESLDYELEGLSDDGSFADDIEKQILIDQILRRFKPEERFIYDQIVLGYTYDEIATRFKEEFKKHVDAVALRVRFHRAVARIARLA